MGADIPAKWSLLDGLTLYDWQSDCIASWFAAGKRGTVKVVTGAGKTILALGLIERMQNQVQTEAEVARSLQSLCRIHLESSIATRIPWQGGDRAGQDPGPFAPVQAPPDAVPGRSDSTRNGREG